MFTKLPVIMQSTNSNMRNQIFSVRGIKTAVFCLPVLFAALCLYFKVSNKPYYQHLISEDSVFEWAQCFLYAAAGLLSVYCACLYLRCKRSLSALSFLIIAAGLLFVAGEEISWGHSMLKLELPSYFREHNVQGDLTLHNLDSVQPYLHNAYIMVGFFGAFSWLLLRICPQGRAEKQLSEIVPSGLTTLYFLPTFLFYLYVEHLLPFVRTLNYSLLDVTFDYRKSFILYKDQEAVELLLAMGSLIFVIQALLRAHRLRREDL